MTLFPVFVKVEGLGMTPVYLCRLSCVRWAWTGLCSNPLCSSGSGVQLCCDGSWDKRLRSSSPTVCTAPCWSDISGREGCSYTLGEERLNTLHISVIERQIIWWAWTCLCVNTGGSFIHHSSVNILWTYRRLGLYLRTGIRGRCTPVVDVCWLISLYFC